jgi:hypothetical protein
MTLSPLSGYIDQVSFFGDAKLYHPIYHSHRISGDIYHCWH